MMSTGERTFGGQAIINHPQTHFDLYHLREFIKFNDISAVIAEHRTFMCASVDYHPNIRTLRIKEKDILSHFQCRLNKSDLINRNSLRAFHQIEYYTKMMNKLKLTEYPKCEKPCAALANQNTKDTRREDINVNEIEAEHFPHFVTNYSEQMNFESVHIAKPNSTSSADRDIERLNFIDVELCEAWQCEYVSDNLQSVIPEYLIPSPHEDLENSYRTAIKSRSYNAYCEVGKVQKLKIKRVGLQLEKLRKRCLSNIRRSENVHKPSSFCSIFKRFLCHSNVASERDLFDEFTQTIPFELIKSDEARESIVQTNSNIDNQINSVDLGHINLDREVPPIVTYSENTLHVVNDNAAIPENVLKADRTFKHEGESTSEITESIRGKRLEDTVFRKESSQSMSKKKNLVKRRYRSLSPGEHFSYNNARNMTSSTFKEQGKKRKAHTRSYVNYESQSSSETSSMFEKIRDFEVKSRNKLRKRRKKTNAASNQVLSDTNSSVSGRKTFSYDVDHIRKEIYNLVDTSELPNTLQSGDGKAINERANCEVHEKEESYKLPTQSKPPVNTECYNSKRNTSRKTGRSLTQFSQMSLPLPMLHLPISLSEISQTNCAEQCAACTHLHPVQSSGKNTKSQTRYRFLSACVSENIQLLHPTSTLDVINPISNKLIPTFTHVTPRKLTKYIL